MFQVPAFETNNGECIFESNAIAMAVSNEQLLGKTAIDRARIVQWMNFAGEYFTLKLLINLFG